MKRKVLFLIVPFLVFSLFLLFNGGEEEAVEEEVTGFNQYTWKTEQGTFVLSERIAKKVAAGEKLVIRNSTWDPSAPFFKDVRVGIDKAIKEFGFDYKMVGPADGIVEKQISELETLIKAEQIDGLSITCGEADTMIPLFDMAWERGIPVITYDCDSPESKRLAYVGWEHPMIGQIGAKYLMKFHPEKTGKLALFAAFPEGVYARGRFEGFFSVLDENGYQLDVVGPFKLGLDMAEGYGVVENTFLANPDIEIIYTVDEFVEVPAQYVKRNNLKGKVIVIGVNDLPGVLIYVREGVINQTTGINPAGQGYLTGKMLYEFITTGKVTPEKTWVQLDEVTPENVEEHMKAKGLL